MQEQPLVSVIMPVYNAAPFLQKAIDSILQQTYSHFEFIIINDCSSDKSDSIIKGNHDPRIIYHIQLTNLGVVAAMNKGIDLASGKYIAVMHADDIALPQRLEKQVAALKANPSLAVIAGKSIFIDEHDEPTGATWKLDEATITTTAIKAAMVKECCISHPTTMMQADVVKKYRYYSSPQHQGFAVEDYPLWLHLLSDGYSIGKLDEAVLLYRVHSTSATGTYLRRKNPFLVNYYSKQFYLQQRRAAGKLNAFDKVVARSMKLDYLKAIVKNIKGTIIRK
jgi:glycosyltransferase involved in cell wall biosynthesis